MVRSLWILLVVTAPVALAGPRMKLPESYRRNLEAPVEAQVCKAVRGLASAQADFDGARATWEWTSGSGPAENTAGLIALALTRAPACGAGEALDRYVAARLEQHQAHAFLFDPDIEALAAAARVRGDDQLLAHARKAFARRYEGASGEELWARWESLRPRKAHLGFDAALAIRAALAVGEEAKAVELADAAVKAYPRWAEGPDVDGARTLAQGAMLDALLRTDAKRYARAAQDLTHHLVLAQSADGSFGRSTQATAYAVAGLARSGEPFTAEVDRARRWLRLTQLSGGAWASYNDFLPEPFVGEQIHEVTAEVVLALAR